MEERSNTRFGEWKNEQRNIEERIMRENEIVMVVGNGIIEYPNTQEGPVHRERDDSEKEHLCRLELSFSHPDISSSGIINKFKT